VPVVRSARQLAIDLYNKNNTQVTEINIKTNNFENSRLAGSHETQQASWFVIHTKPRQEQIAEYNLQNQEFEVFLPRYAVEKRKKHAIVSHIEPYFPRYLFVRFNESSDDWGPIRSTRGVSSLVRFNGRPRSVPNRLIKMLRENENTDGLQRVNKSSWKPGDEVEIEEGPFAGYRCIFEAVRSSERVSVLLNIIGKQTRAVIKQQDLAIPQFA
jgi:transcriptional antiterminator RfaH